MVESSAAARKSFLLSLREKKTPLLRTNSDKRKGGTYIYIGDFWCSFQKKSGTFVQPFRTVGGLPCCPSTTTTTTTNLFPPWTVGSGWHCRFLPHQGPPKKKKQPAALNCLLFRHGGRREASPSPLGTSVGLSRIVVLSSVYSTRFLN